MSLFLAFLALVSAATSQAATIVQFELTGKGGTEVSDPATSLAPNISGIDLTRGSGLTPSAGSNSMNSSGWNDLSVNDFYSFGFTVSGGTSVKVNELQLSTRSSATGPGFINVLYSADGGPQTLLATLTQPNTLFLDEDLTFAPISVTSSFQIFLRVANGTSASGGAIGSAATFRVSDYSPDGDATFLPVTLNGAITTVTAVPEPGFLFLMGASLLGLGALRRGKP